MDKAKVTRQVRLELERVAARRASDRANVARWDLNVAILLFAVVIIVIISSSQGIGLEVVAPIAIFGLAIAWLVGWRRGRKLYQRYYDEELSKLGLEPKKVVKEPAEETIEEKVQRALRDRWK